MSSKIIGRLIGKSVAELSFRSFRDSYISIGSIVTVNDESRDRTYLLRVIDVSYGHESSEANWAEKAAGRMMEEDTRGNAYRIHDPDRRLYKLVKCSPLGYVSNNAFHRPRSIPEHFSRVLTPDEETMAFLREYSGDLIVGHLRCGEDTLNIPLGIDGTTLSQHVGIFATTGMGKSNLMKVLAAAIMEHPSYGLLIFDPHGEYFDGGQGGKRKGLKHHPLAEKRLFTRSLRKLSGNKDTLAIPLKDIEIEDITQIFGFSQAQYEALQAIRIKYGKEWLIKLISIDIETLIEELRDSRLNFHESTMAVLIRRANHLAEFRTVTKDNDYASVGDIVAKVQSGKAVLIDTANLSQDEDLLVTSVITRSVLKSYKYKYQQAEGEFDKLSPCLIMLEEAQRVLMASAGDTNIFHRVVREGRKFKVGLGVITQQPKLLSEELLSQLNSMFILGLADERDRTIMRSSSKQDISSLGTEIQTLAAGEAILTSPTVPFALPLKIFLYEDYLARLPKDIAKPAERPAEGFF
ncbi:MAG: ATP-binding protein [Candidatus Zixiibacteriota bacterium]